MTSDAVFNILYIPNKFQMTLKIIIKLIERNDLDNK